MAIIQISKLQQRSGNLVDLPQLSDAEFGWASDEKRLFIGKETPNENIEVLTSYSEIDFSQLQGSVGNLNISSANVANGQVLGYDGNNWVNKGGSAGGFISLGTVSNVQITGGAINYVLTTDGLGNLSWTPKGALYTTILSLSNTNPIVMTVNSKTPYVNDAEITITGVTAAIPGIVNGESFYIQLAGDYPDSGNVSLYTSPGGSGPVDGTTLGYTGNGIATSTVGSGSGSGLPGGTTNSVQYYDGSGFAGDANFTWNGSNLSVTGTANISNNLSVGGIVTATQLVSNIATGTAPLTVTSITKVANLNVDMIDGYDTSVASSPSTVVVRDAGGNVLSNTVNTNSVWNGTSNIVIISGSNVSTFVASSERIRATTSGAEIFGNLLSSNVYANSGTIGASLLTGTLTTAAQPNVTSVGTLTSVAITGNATAGNVYANSGIIGASLLTGTLTTAAQPNITSVGTLTSLAVTANVTTGGIKTDNYYYANGVSISFAGAYSNSNVAAYLPTYTGNITAANITTSSYVIRSVGTSLSAAGSVQGDATLLAKDINVVSTVSAGQGVRLPVAVAGMVIIVNNTSATSLNVYPSTGATINSLATNAAYTHAAAASLQYYAISATQWYTIGATYT